MFNLFKEKIPKEDQQEVTVLQSWTLEWRIQDNGYDSYKVFYKSFIESEDAKEYEKQLKESAKFLGTWVKTKIREN